MQYVTYECWLVYRNYWKMTVPELLIHNNQNSNQLKLLPSYVFSFTVVINFGHVKALSTMKIKQRVMKQQHGQKIDNNKG